MRQIKKSNRMKYVVSLSLLLLSASIQTVIAAPSKSSNSLVEKVNTFIGSKDDGNTFPGASAPFGLIQVSPIGEHYAGWRYDDPRIRGFGHSFISGAGCWEQGGQISVLPVTGTIGAGGTFNTEDPKSFDHKKYGARYSHEGEVGQAGYYKVRLLDYDGIDAEATALTRAAAERYTFSDNTKEGHILINVGQANEKHSVIGNDITIVGDRIIEGKVVTNSFCGGHQYTTWFRMEFDQPIKSHGVWDREGGVPNARHTMEGEVKPSGVWVTFDVSNNKSVTTISAISHVDSEGAKTNLHSEGYENGKALTFDAMRAKSQKVWENELNKVRVTGGDNDDKTVFYTSLYHSLLQPMTGSDADGRYRGFDDNIHRAEGWTYYEYFSLWDTYRSQNQLLAMLKPKETRDIARSVLTIHEQGGWLPRWAYANFETNIMTGDPVTPFLVDLWRFGALEGREQQAYAALRQNAFELPPINSRHAGRSGNAHYLKEGFVKFDRAFPSKGMDVDPHHGGSSTLEYSLADCSLAQMANGLGKTQDAEALKARGRNWKNIWDASVKDDLGFTGFPRPRTEDGKWYVPPRGIYSPRSEYGFHEGTAWQYQWLAQQDVPGLVEAMGGKEGTSKRLDAFFAYNALVNDISNAARKEWVVGPYSYYNQYHYNPNNEPDLHTPWMYTLIGEPWKTTTVLRAAQHLFTNAPNGVTGNDDLGTMSAWYLFSAVGLYPAVPGSGQFLLHTPRFEKIEMDLSSGKTLTIQAPTADGNGLQYIQNVNVNGKDHANVWLDWETLQQGGTIKFKLAAEPATQGWGTTPASLPSSYCSIRQEIK